MASGEVTNCAGNAWMSALDFQDNRFAGGRKAQKARFGGELLIAEAPADLEEKTFLDYFQHEVRRGLLRRKGIIGIRIGGSEINGNIATTRLRPRSLPRHWLNSMTGQKLIRAFTLV
ncbi:MAG: hypothetical protein ACRD82_02180 [Blastocatellia bacterium]